MPRPRRRNRRRPWRDFAICGVVIRSLPQKASPARRIRRKSVRCRPGTTPRSTEAWPTRPPQQHGNTLPRHAPTVTSPGTRHTRGGAPPKRWRRTAPRAKRPPTALRRAHELATDLQAAPLLTEIEALARSTRVSLATIRRQPASRAGRPSWPDSPRTGDPRSHRRRAHLQRDRSRPGCQREDRQRARVQPVAQNRHGQPGRARPALPPRADLARRELHGHPSARSP